MADRDAHLTDPAFRDDPGRAPPRPGLRAHAGRPDRPAPCRATRARHQPGRRRHGLPRGGRRRRQRGQPDRVELPRVRLRASWTLRPGSTTRTGAATSASTQAIRTCSSRASGRSTRSSPGCCSGTGSPAPWVVAGSMGGDAQPQVHAQLVSALVDGGLDIRTAVTAPRWYVEPAGALRAAGRGPARAPARHRHRRGARGARPSGHARAAVRREPRPRARDRAGRRRTGGAGRLARGRHRPPQRWAAGRLLARCARCRSAPANHVRILRAAGGRQRSHDAATGLAVRRHRAGRGP